jgi:hypothetical protein
VLRDTFAAHGGVEVDTQGDAFFVAFPTAAEAIEAAGSGQRALESGPIRVRMGLHTGTPTATAEGYVGVDVHRGARVAALAHGGQVIVSATTAALVEDEPLRALGRHRLKDFDAPPSSCFNSAYWPVVEVLKQLEAERSRLELDPAAAEALAALLGESGTSSTDEIAWAFRKLLEAVAGRGPS